LLQMRKEFVDAVPLEFPRTQPLAYERTLLSVDRREELLLDLERGRRNHARLKYQTRARKVVVLARIDLDGPAHRNPPGVPYRPSQRLLCPHFHRSTEGFEDRIAFDPADVPGLILRDSSNGLSCWEDCLAYCAVQNVPAIQLAV